MQQYIIRGKSFKSKHQHIPTGGLVREVPSVATVYLCFYLGSGGKTSLYKLI